MTRVEKTPFVLDAASSTTLGSCFSECISPLAVSSAHVRTAGGERSWHTTLIAARRARYGTAELTLAIANLCVV